MKQRNNAWWKTTTNNTNNNFMVYFSLQMYLCKSIMDSPVCEIMCHIRVMPGLQVVLQFMKTCIPSARVQKRRQAHPSIPKMLASGSIILTSTVLKYYIFIENSSKLHFCCRKLKIQHFVRKDCLYLWGWLSDIRCQLAVTCLRHQGVESVALDHRKVNIVVEF